MFHYLSIEAILDIHDEIISILGGLPGTKDKQQIESILQHIQNDDYYPSLLDKTVHLFFSMVKFHCFNDGNKRTSVVCIYIFLQNNDVFIDDLYVKLEDIVIGVADGSLDKEYLKKYFETLFISFGYEKYLK